jgi:hypothetical protein
MDFVRGRREGRRLTCRRSHERVRKTGKTAKLNRKNRKNRKGKKQVISSDDQLTACANAALHFLVDSAWNAFLAPPMDRGSASDGSDDSCFCFKRDPQIRLSSVWVTQHDYLIRMERGTVAWHTSIPSLLACSEEGLCCVLLVTVRRRAAAGSASSCE